MGTAIIPIDLSTAVVGTTGDINIPTVTSEEGYHLLLFNESGCGLKLRFYESGDTDNIPAGGWRKYPLIPGEDTVTWTVIYTLPNAPVSLLIGTLYKPGEKVPDVGTLGNSPISIGGTVATSSIQTLSNENSVLGTKIVDIGTLTIGDLLDIFNDHFLWKVQQSGVAHQVLAGNTSGVPLQIGQAGDTSEVLGNLKVDGTSTLTGNVSASGDITDSGGSLNMTGSGAGKGNVNINDFLQFYNLSSVLRQFATILSATNNPTLFSSADHGQLDIKKSDQATLMARFDEAAGLTVYSAMNLLPVGLIDNDGAGGTSILYQVLVGSVKLAVIVQASWKNSGAAINRALPAPFIQRALCWGSNLAGLSFLSLGSAITFARYTGIGANGFTNTQVTAFNSSSLNELSAFDTIQYSGGNGSTHDGVMFIIGF